jgi:ribonuclease T1
VLRALLVLTGLLAILGCASPAATQPDARVARATQSPTRSSAAATSTLAAASRQAADPASGLPVVHVSDLPPEAKKTLALIDRGGPFPHPQDGETFQNREGLLPARRSGYYKEYTVETPGSDDRGARRIVAGGGGERYWTNDHYDSFAWIAPS